VRARSVSGIWSGLCAATLAVVLCLTGCSSAQPAASSTPRAPRSTGVLTTSRFTVEIPTGWRNQTSNQAEVSRFSENGTVLLLFEAPPPGRTQPNVNDVTANINVVLAGSPVPDDQLAFYLSSVNQSGATNLSQPEPFTLNGQTGLYVTYESNVSGTPGKSQDMVVNYKGETYDIIMNTSKFAFPMQLPALMLLLDTWKWRS